jgi:hypothetical protein
MPSFILLLVEVYSVIMPYEVYNLMAILIPTKAVNPPGWLSTCHHSTVFYGVKSSVFGGWQKVQVIKSARGKDLWRFK